MSKEIKHTPGPWLRKEFVIKCSRDIRKIATIGTLSGKDMEDSYNARLITAAPELLEALINCLDFIAEGYSNKAQFKVDWQKQLAVIANATGDRNYVIAA